MTEIELYNHLGEKLKTHNLKTKTERKSEAEELAIIDESFLDDAEKAILDFLTNPNISDEKKIEVFKKSGILSDIKLTPDNFDLDEALENGMHIGELYLEEEEKELPLPLKIKATKTAKDEETETHTY